MEADEYFSTYDALHDKKEKAVRRQLPLKTSESCGIMKIVWSQFDFMTGPELKFVWEVTPSSSLSPMNLSAEECSVADAESLIDSGGSNQSVNFEDIDDPLKAELTCLDGMDDNFLVDSFANLDGNLTQNQLFKFKTQRYLDDYMTESRTTTGTGSTRTFTGEDSRFFDESEFAKSLRDEGYDAACGLDPAPNTQAVSPHFFVASPQDSLSTLLAKRYPEDVDFNEKNTSKSSSSDVRSGSIGCADDSHDDLHFDDDLKRSCVDSGVGVSTHSDLSALCRTPPPTHRGIFTSTPLLHSFEKENSYEEKKKERDTWTQFDLPFVEFPEDVISDEKFVAKCVLAEQICSAPHSRCPVQHKMIISRARHLLVSSYIFTAQTRDGNSVTYAISFLMSNDRQDWYMDRQLWFERIICDSIPKLKASIFAEDNDDVLVRVTSELARLMSLLSALERFALVSPERPLMIKNTLLTERGTSLTDNRILSRAISGCLQSQGNCVVIGSDNVMLTKLLNTLAFFVPEDSQWCTLRPYRHKYNPYFRLQAVRRAELPTLIHSGVASPWPVCIIDTDRSAVCISAPYQRHRVLRARNDSRGVRQIFEHAGVMPESNSKGKTPQLELNTCRTLECVASFLRRIDLLPMEESIRQGFCAQLMLYIDNLAKAFIGYVQEASEPMSDEKECGVRSRKFSLSATRKALDLQQDALFNAVLARAELIRPDIAEFIFM